MKTALRGLACSGSRWSAAVVVALTPVFSIAQAQPEQGKSSATPRLDPTVIKAFGGTKAVTRPSRDAVMGFSLPTQVTEVIARGGQDVTTGQLLLRGDDAEDMALLTLQRVRAESDLAVQGAQKRMELAKLEFDRLEETQRKNAATQQEVDRARLTFEVAQIEFLNAKVQQTQEVIQLDRLNARVGKFRLIAPFDGEVESVMCDVGQAVAENEKIVRVVDVDPLWIDVPAPTEDPVTLTLKNGDPAWVLLDVGTTARVAEGKVIEVSPVTDLPSRSRRIRVEVPNPKGPDRLLAGEPSWVRFMPPATAMLAPTDGTGK